MKLVTFRHRDRTTIGRLDGKVVVDIPASDAALPSSMLELLRAGPDAMEKVRLLPLESAVTHPLASVVLEAPVPNPAKFLAIGMNYAKHVEEARAAGISIPETQVWFNKQVSCVNGPYSAVHMPHVSDKLDYEAELAVVIGRRGRHITRDQAPLMVAGYMICNDVSVRDWQMRTPTMTLGKSFDTHGPTGPWIVTPEELGDPHRLRMRMVVNGQVRQEVSTADMIADVWDQIAYLSTVMTLEPGDILATGTPSGVGVAAKPPNFLKIGDVMRVEIDGIGHIENTVVGEPQ